MSCNMALCSSPTKYIKYPLELKIPQLRPRILKPRNPKPYPNLVWTHIWIWTQPEKHLLEIAKKLAAMPCQQILT
jgi:hypothetical protein